jgi:hypothetical protein
MPFDNNINFQLFKTPQENDLLKGVGIKVKYIDIVNISDNKVYVSEDDINKVIENDKIYADGDLTGTGLTMHQPYYVQNIDYAECSFELSNGTFKVNVAWNDGLSFKQFLSEVYITNVEEHLGDTPELLGEQSKYYTFQIKRYVEGEVRELTTYGGTGSNLLGDYYRYTPVVAEWYTPIFDLGRNDISKRLMGFTIFNEKIEGGDLLFGYDTRMVNELISVKGIDIFSFDNYDYTTFTYETGFVKSFTRKVKERAFNFIMFKFKSVNPADCIINSVTVRYKENRHTKGAE